ncbi:MAG TPA: membrane-bound PQQ-dependent dehydrogenase, glucose/quinate/shikimate family, partial [Acinetobacter radioresistens]|nr:membrane-bound PQQ-dependent dehydrogenase, glucose/quinate/shikimate family [Acinetobacter radioresistens]
MNRASSRSKMNLITVFIFTIIGIGLLIGGIWLAAIGGSIYYIIAAVLMLLTAFLLYKGRISALLVYAALVLGTVIWAIWEVGTDFWALAPRLD